MSAETRAHVESIYLNTLDRLEAILESQPYLLGGKPCLADFGFFASMFRHFSEDPTPRQIMQQRAPAVFAWVGRMWNAKHSTTAGAWVPAGTLPTGWQPILKDIGEAYLPYLHANAHAWRDGRRTFDLGIQGTRYRNLPVVQYRVWCRERLQTHLEALPAGVRTAVESTLAAHGCLAPLLKDGRIESRLHSGSPPVCRPRRVGLLEKIGLYFTGTHWQVPRLNLDRTD